MGLSDEMKKKLDASRVTAALRTNIDSDLLRPLQLPLSQTNPAAWTRKRLLEYIKDFEDDLDAEHEVGARLVSFGQTVTFHIADVGYYGPDIISFSGIDDQGQKVQLIQHTSQLSVLLIALKKQAEKPRRIGFLQDEESSADTGEV